MSLDKFEKLFLDKSKKEPETLKLSLASLAKILDCDTVNMGKVIEIRAKELSGLSLALQLASENTRHSLLVDADKSFDKNWYNNHPNLLLTGETNFDSLYTFIQHTDDIKVIIINTVLSLLPVGSSYEEFEEFVCNIVNHSAKHNKTIIFINPYLDNKYDVISRYSDLIITTNKRRSIKKNEERLGYNLDGEVIKNTINFKLGKFEFMFLYKGGVK